MSEKWRRAEKEIIKEHMSPSSVSTTPGLADTDRVKYSFRKYDILILIFYLIRSETDEIPLCVIGPR